MERKESNQTNKIGFSSEKWLRSFKILLQSGVRPNQDGNFAVQMVAMETGHVSVKLEVTTLPGRSQILGDLTLRDELQIQVRIYKSYDKKKLISHIVE